LFASLIKRIWNSLFGSRKNDNASESAKQQDSESPKTKSPGEKRQQRPQRQHQEQANAQKKPLNSKKRPAPAPKAAKTNDDANWSALQQPLGNKKKMDDWQPPAPIPEEPELFQNFSLDRRILKAILVDLGFQRCTPIQAKALPVILDGQDMAGKAQTGTGKTAVFLIKVLQAFLNSTEKRALNQPFALVLAPTRELALQIAEDAENLSPYTSLRTVAVFGGIDYERQRKLVQAGTDLIVATPGRLIDFIHQHAIDLSALKMLVIDEADRMLDMGFIPDVKRIVSQCPSPSDRQTLLFSATLSHDIMALAARWMRPDPTVIEIEPEHIVADGIEETTYACTSREKLPILLWTLKHEECTRVLIFRNRRRDVEELHSLLQRAGVASEMLSGDVDQKKRLRILDQFKDGKVKVIVATDVAGRGIHVDDVSHVFNFDFPYEAEDYVHRIGRTARAGRKGRAINFADEDCAFVIPDIEEYIKRSLPITNPDEEMLEMPALAPRANRDVDEDSYDSHHSSKGKSFGHRSCGPRAPRAWKDHSRH